MLFFLLFFLGLSHKVFLRDFIRGIDGISIIESGLNKNSDQNPNCQIYAEIPEFFVYQNNKINNGIFSIDPKVEGAPAIAAELLSKSFSSTIFIGNTTYLITNDQNLDKNDYYLIDISQNFPFLQNISTKYDVFSSSEDNSNIKLLCSARSYKICPIFIITLLIILFCVISYFLISYHLKHSRVNAEWWIFNDKGDIIYGPPPTIVDEISFNSVKTIALLSLKRKIPTARINSCVRNEGPLKYKWIFAFPMANNTVLATLCSEILKQSNKINLSLKFEKHKENVTEPVITYTSPRDSKPVRISYLDKNNVSCTIYLPSNVLVPFQPFGSLTTIINSTFADIKKALLHNQYTETNFFTIVESLCTKLGISNALFFDENNQILFEYSLNGNKLSEENVKHLLDTVQFSNHADLYHHIFADNDYAFTYCLHTNSFSISVALILDHDEDNLTLVNFALPLISSCCVYLYFLSYTKEQSLKFDRFVNLFTQSDSFALIEIDRNTKKVLLLKSSMIKTPISNLDELLQHTSLLSKEFTEYYYKECHSLPPGGSIKQSICHIPDTNRWFSISGVATPSNDSILTLLIEEITNIKKQEIEFNNTLSDIQLAMKSLDMKKFTIKDNNKICMETDDLFKQLNIQNIPEDKSINQFIHPNDLQKLEKGLTNSRLTIRLVNEEEKTSWYSIISDGSTGFIFCINELVEMRNKMQTTGKGLALVASSSLVLWSVQIKDDTVKPLLQQPTIWDALSIDTNTKFSRFTEFVHEDEREIVTNAIQKIKSGELKQWSGEARLFKVGNIYEWHRIIFALSGNTVIHCLAVNIHNQKMVELELIETQRLMDILLSSGKLMLWEFINSDEELPETVEFKPGIDNRLRMSWPFVDRQIPEEQRGLFKLRMMECFKGNETFEMNLPLIFKTGQIYVSARGKLHHSTNVVQGVCIDITDLTNTLTELEEQNKRAEEANKQKTVFLANMSHEIRTPMNGIFGILDIIASQELTSEQRVLIDSIRSSSFQLMKLLDDTLNLSKIEQGDIENNPTIFNFGSVLEPICIGTSSRARMNHVKFQFQVDRQFPLIGYADQQLFVQIINNLLSNALKFTKSGYIRVKLGWNVVGPVEICILDVCDTGIGISEEQQRVIFERFSQADPSVMRKFGGTGLGLSLVQEIVRYLGGNISVKSKPGEGSQFHVEIPMQSIYFFYSPPFSDHKKHIVFMNVTDEYLEYTIRNWVTSNNYIAMDFKKIDDILQRMSNPDEIIEVVFIEGQNDLCRRVLQTVGRKEHAPTLCSINEPEEPAVLPTPITTPVRPHQGIHFRNTLR